MYKEIEKFNLIKKSKDLLFMNFKEKIVLEDGREESELFDFLVETDYDDDGGFSSSGKFKLASPKKNKSLVSNDFIKEGFLFKPSDLKSGKVNVGFDSERFSIQDPMMSNYVEDKVQSLENKCGYYADLNFLYDEYFFDFLKEIYKKKTNSENASINDIYKYIKKMGIQSEIESYLIDITDIYNNSFLDKKELFKERSSISGYDFSHNRFLECVNDEKFISNINVRKALLENSINSVYLNNSNIRADKNISFLDFMEAHQKELDSFADELVYRGNLPLKGKNMGEVGVISRDLKDAKNYGKNLKNGIIFTDEKKLISEYENKIFKGTINETEKENFQALINNIQKRYENKLKRIKIIRDNLYKDGYGESIINGYKLKEHNDSKTSLQDLELLQNSFNFRLQTQSDTLDAQVILAQNKQLETEINKHSEITETGDILLDEEKKAVINKIRSLLHLSNENIKESQIKTLLENDIPALKNIVYKTESFCGLKDFYLNDMQEEQRKELLGEHYHYLSADKFFNKILKKTEELNNNSLELARGTLFQTINERLELFAAMENVDSDMALKILETFRNIKNSDLKDSLPENNDIQEINLKVDKLLERASLENQLDLKTNYDSLKNFLCLKFKESLLEVSSLNRIEVSNAEAVARANVAIEGLNDSLTHQVSNMADLKKKIGLILETNESEKIDLFTNDKLDIRKILLLRKSLYEEFNNVPLITADDKLKKSNIASKIVFLEEKILNYKVNRNEDTLAVSVKDKMAFTALNTRDTILKDFNTFDKEKNIKEINKFEKSLKVKKDELDSLKSQKESLFDKKFMVSKRKLKIEKLEEEIIVLQQEINEKKELNKKHNAFIADNLQKIADDLEKSLESNKSLDKEIPIVEIQLKKEIEDLRKTLEDINTNKDLKNLEVIIKEINTNNSKANSRDVAYQYSMVINALRKNSLQEIKECLYSSEYPKDKGLLTMFNQNFGTLDESAKEKLFHVISQISEKNIDLQNEIALDSDEVDKQFQIILAGVKTKSYEDIVERINFNEKKDGDFLLKLINSEFGPLEKEKKEKIIEAITNINDKYSQLKDNENITVDGFRMGINNILRESYDMIPLDINESNELYKELNDGKNTYNYKITFNEHSIDIPSQEVFLFKSFLRDGDLTTNISDNLSLLKKEYSDLKEENECLNKLEELEQSFTNILAAIKKTEIEVGEDNFTGKNIKIDISLTEEGRNTLIKYINAYGDDKKVLFIPEAEGLNFNKALALSLDSSSGDNTSLTVDYDKYLKATDNLNYLIYAKAHEIELSENPTEVKNEPLPEVIDYLKESVEEKNDKFSFIDKVRKYCNSNKKDSELGNQIVEYLENPENEQFNNNFLNPKDLARYLKLENKPEEILKVSKDLRELLARNSESEILKQKIDILQQIKPNSEKLTNHEEQKERKPKSIFESKDNKIELAEILDDIKKKIDLVTKNAAYNNGFSLEEREKIEEFEKAIKEIETSMSSKKLKKEDLKENLEKSKNLNQQIEETFEKRFKQIEEKEQKEEFKEQKDEKTKNKDSNDFEV